MVPPNHPFLDGIFPYKSTIHCLVSPSPHQLSPSCSLRAARRCRAPGWSSLCSHATQWGERRIHPQHLPGGLGEETTHFLKKKNNGFIYLVLNSYNGCVMIIFKFNGLVWARIYRKTLYLLGKTWKNHGFLTMFRPIQWQMVLCEMRKMIGFTTWKAV